MDKHVKKSIRKLDKKEIKFLQKPHKESKIKNKIYEKVPSKLQSALEGAFVKAFEKIFLQGTGIIEKTFDKTRLGLEFEKNNYIADKLQTNKSLKGVDKPSKASNRINGAIATASGIGLGVLGMGLPDIPIFVATMLKGVYEIATSYGFTYDSEKEKIYILRLIRTALCQDKKREEYSLLLDSCDCQNTDLQGEIAITARVLSNAMLVEKFVQGLPIVGVIGGYFNYTTYKKVAKISAIKYKKRYLNKKSADGV